MIINGKLHRAVFLTCISLLTITACGGGGGSSTSTPGSGNGNSDVTDTGKGTSKLDESSSSICFGAKSDDFNCLEMLDSITNDGIKPLVTGLSNQINSLNTEVNEYCNNLEQASEAEKLTDAQSQWREVMSSWQQLEVMQFGLIAEQRDHFYSWPLNDECKVDVDVVLAQGSNYDISSRTSPRRGLDALEYLLFDSVGDNGKLHVRCQTVGAGKITNVPGLLEWNDLSLPDQKAQRCKQSANITEHLITRANTLKQSIEKGVFDETVSSLQDAADSISDALFYIDKKTKDEKSVKALPQNASGAFNTGHLESQYAKVSLENIHNNLLGAKVLMTADGNSGLYNFLVAVGSNELADRMLANLDAAIVASSVAEIPDSMHSLIDGASSTQVTDCINATTGESTSLGKICALGAPVIQAFTSDLKNQFVLTLGFSIPSTAEGDND